MTAAIELMAAENMAASRMPNKSVRTVVDQKVNHNVIGVYENRAYAHWSGKKHTE